MFLSKLELSVKLIACCHLQKLYKLKTSTLIHSMSALDTKILIEVGRKREKIFPIKMFEDKQIIYSWMIGNQLL